VQVPLPRLIERDSTGAARGAEVGASGGN
jgi:hypothetical protein